MRFRSACSAVATVAATVVFVAVVSVVFVAVVFVAVVFVEGVVAPVPVDAAACEAAAIPGPPPVAAQATGFHAIAPVRLLDTRDSGVRIRAGCTVAVDLSTNTAIPAGAQALALNVTTVDAAARGFVTVYPCGSSRPDASNVNSRAVDPAANSVLVQVDASRRICLFTQTSLHLVVDATGWFGRFGAPYNATSSVRLLDTRTTLRPDGGSGLPPPATELRLPVAGGVVPAEASAVAVNVTTTDALAPGYLTAYPCGQRPPTSTVNFLATEQRANHVVIGLDTDGALCLWSNVSVHIVVDVEGWFGGPAGSGTTFRPLLGSRVLDTRVGIGGITGIIPAQTTVAFDPSAGARLPLGTTVALNMVATEAVSPGFVTLYPCSSGQPATSTVNAVLGTEATNVAFVTVDADSRICLFASATMHVVVDVIGTFGPGGPLHQLSISQRALGQVFAADAHDYTMRCVAGPNLVTIHAVGAPGTIVSVAPSSAPVPLATGPTADATLTLREDEAFVVRAGPAGAAPEEYWVRCLPHDFPVLKTTIAEAPSPGWYLTDAAFPTPTPGDQSRFLMILDNRSVPVWYHRVTDPTIDLTRLSDGTLVWTKLLGLAFGSTPGGAFEIHRLDGTLIRSIATVSGPTDHHDIAELPNGDVVLATYVARKHVDLRVLGTGFGADELVYDSHLEEIRPDGTVAWTWKSEDHIPTSASTFAQRFPGVAGVGVDLVHINSIHVAPDGDLIVSARHTDTVYKIRRNPAGDVVLRVGGNQSDVTFVGDPLGGFARQHDAQLLPNGHLRLYDNRTGIGPPRAVEYALDLTRRTATLVWSLARADITSSGGVGSTRGLGDGDIVVAWGGSTLPAFTEFGPDGSELQSTTMVDHFPYRVEKEPVGAFDINVLRATAGR